jgi:hypothetical protein
VNRHRHRFGGQGDDDSGKKERPLRAHPFLTRLILTTFGFLLQIRRALVPGVGSSGFRKETEIQAKRRQAMNRRRINWLAVLAITVMAVAPAFGRNSHRVTLFNAETLGTTKLAAGEYLLRWETHSPEATVTFQGYGKMQGTLKGKVVEHEKKFEQDVVIDEPAADGSRQLLEIRLGGTNKSIVFSES